MARVAASKEAEIVRITKAKDDLQRRFDQESEELRGQLHKESMRKHSIESVTRSLQAERDSARRRLKELDG